MISPSDTIAAIATPPGEGGIGVLRISGQSALDIATKIFRPAKSIDLLTAPSHSCYYGTILNVIPGGSRPGIQVDRNVDPPLTAVGDDVVVIDQAVLTLFKSPHSYTGEDVIEISAHGSPFILQKILALCVVNGARLAGPGEFTERAFLHGKMDLTQAEAVAELIRAKTDKSQAAALAQVQGSLAQKVRGLKEKLLPLLAHLEVGLDHADEDHDFLKRDELITACQYVEQEIDEIMASAKTSKVLREGFRVALLGRPNVGKSSLMNSLLKEERAIVTPIAGTTRDTLEEMLSIEGIPVILTDTAGLRDQTTDPVEKLGIERTRKSLDQADFVIGLFDGSEALTEEDKQVIASALQKPHLWVINKTDLPAQLTADSLHTYNGGAPIVSLSTKTGKGLADLVSQIAHHAIEEKATSSEAQWLLNTRHTTALLKAREALTQAQIASKENALEECVALELQTALSALGEIIGETSTEDLLGEVFSRFCIGK